jgi:hypothetical protein
MGPGTLRPLSKAPATAGAFACARGVELPTEKVRDPYTGKAAIGPRLG